MKTKKSIKKFSVGELFSFTKKGAVHMVTRKASTHIEYKSYCDGKIRVYSHPKDSEMNREVFKRPEYNSLYNHKWFVPFAD